MAYWALSLRYPGTYGGENTHFFSLNLVGHAERDPRFRLRQWWGGGETLDTKSPHLEVMTWWGGEETLDTKSPYLEVMTWWGSEETLDTKLPHLEVMTAGGRNGAPASEIWSIIVRVNSGGRYPHCVKPTNCRILYRDLEHWIGEFFSLFFGRARILILEKWRNSANGSWIPSCVLRRMGRM